MTTADTIRLMTYAEKIADRIAETRSLYDEIKVTLGEFNNLQKVEQARAEFEKPTGIYDAEMDELIKKKSDLEVYKRNLTAAASPSSRRVRPRTGPPLAEGFSQPRPPFAREFASADTTARQEATLAARRQLKKIVNRWAYSWRLGASVQGQINQIADNLDRPLGEALLLLDWSKFESRITPREGEEEHLTRLISWGAALIEYRDWLHGEIDTLKTQYRRLLPMLELWLMRDSQEGEQRWQERITATCQAKKSELEKLREDLARLESEVASLKRGFDAAGD